ncbi:hypothetical protein [Rosistilla oblonga]|uniref:hypothetical protein n=1 Tax=Rosistilla oblonga TaxID=2527990 RepID=UPI003A986B41
MRNEIITNAVVNVVDREDRVVVIGCLVVVRRLHLRLKQQLLSYAKAFASCGMPTGMPYPVTRCWRVCTETTSAMLMSGGTQGLSSSGLALMPAMAGSRNA